MPPTTDIVVDAPVQRHVTKVAADHFPWLPIRWLVKDHYDSVGCIGRVHGDVLAVVAGQDEVVFRARSDALIAAMTSKSRHAVFIPRATHNDISLFPEYLSALKEFVAVR
jgi:hypothetical protein